MKRLAFVLPLLAALLQGCSKNGPDASDTVIDDGSLPHGMIVLGEQLEDPYSVRNIKKAIASLYPTRAGSVDVSATHLYVRFLPRDGADFEVLDSLGVELLDHPVDYRVVKEGDWYHDPDIPEGEITWQYAVVPPGFVFPEDIPHEVLDECHIAEQPLSTRSSDGIDWEAVERESFRLTGNADLYPETRGGSKTTAKPKGRITILDPLYSSEPIGVAGVCVSCNVFVKFCRAFTDADGYYQMKESYSAEPRYRLFFNNKRGFAIGRNMLYVPASFSTLGKHGPEGCSVQVSSRSDRALFSRCVVNNAGWDWIGQCKSESGKIAAPPSGLQIWILDLLDCSSAVMLKQGSPVDELFKTLIGEYSPLLNFFMPDITLGIKGLNDYSSIYTSAIHELSHASHYAQVGKDWWSKFEKFIFISYVTSGFVTYGTGTEDGHGYCEVAEMWAYFAEGSVFNERYPGWNYYPGTSWWFKPQVFRYMDDRGLNRYKIFAALLPSVTDRTSLQNQLLLLYPEAASMIRLAFSRYN